jgi:hypothetical protein
MDKRRNRDMTGWRRQSATDARCLPKQVTDARAFIRTEDCPAYHEEPLPYQFQGPESPGAGRHQKDTWPLLQLGGQATGQCSEFLGGGLHKPHVLAGCPEVYARQCIADLLQMHPGAVILLAAKQTDQPIQE